MTERQAATNANATTWLADTLTRWGLADADDRAEWLIKELLGQGIAPVPKPVPLRPTAPASTKAGRERARQIFEQTRSERRTTVNRPHDEETA